jgi:hypothetical protein
MSEYKTAKDYGLKEGDKIICLSRDHSHFGYKDIISLKRDDGTISPWFNTEDGSDYLSFNLRKRQWSKIDFVNQEDNTELKAYDELIRIQKDIEEAIKRIKPVEE